MQKAHYLVLVMMILGWSAPVCSAALTYRELDRMSEGKRASQSDSTSTSSSSGIAVMGAPKVADEQLWLWPFCKEKEIVFPGYRVLSCVSHTDGFCIVLENSEKFSFRCINRQGGHRHLLDIRKTALLKYIQTPQNDSKEYDIRLRPCGHGTVRENVPALQFALGKRGGEANSEEFLLFIYEADKPDWYVARREAPKFCWQRPSFSEAAQWEKLLAQGNTLEWVGRYAANNCTLYYATIVFKIKVASGSSAQPLRFLLDKQGNLLWVTYGQFGRVPDIISTDGTLMACIPPVGNNKLLLWIHDNKQGVHHPELLHDLKMFLYNCTLGYSPKKAWLPYSSQHLLPFTADEQKRLDEYVAKVRSEGYQNEEEYYDVCGF